MWMRNEKQTATATLHLLLEDSPRLAWREEETLTFQRRNWLHKEIQGGIHRLRGLSVQPRHSVLPDYGAERFGDEEDILELPRSVSRQRQWQSVPFCPERTRGPVRYLPEALQNGQHHPRIHWASSLLLPVCQKTEEAEREMSGL